MKSLGIDGTSTQLIRSYLKYRTQEVVFSGNESDWILLNRLSIGAIIVQHLCE